MSSLEIHTLHWALFLGVSSDQRFKEPWLTLTFGVEAGRQAGHRRFLMQHLRRSLMPRAGASSVSMKDRFTLETSWAVLAVCRVP